MLSHFLSAASGLQLALTQPERDGGDDIGRDEEKALDRTKSPRQDRRASFSRNFADGLAAKELSYFDSTPDGGTALWQDKWDYANRPSRFSRDLRNVPHGGILCVVGVDHPSGDRH